MGSANSSLRTRFSWGGKNFLAWDRMQSQNEGAKRKQDHQGKRPQGEGTGKGRGRQRGVGADNSQGRLAPQQTNLLDVLLDLVLRHEAFLGRLQQDMVYIFTFKNQPKAPGSLLPVLYKASQEWREKNQTNRCSWDRPLRVILLCLLRELLQRHRRLEDAGAVDALQELMDVGGQQMRASGVESWKKPSWSPTRLGEP